MAALLAFGSLTAATGCDRSPTSPSLPRAPSPTPPAAVQATVSGTVWLHEDGGVRPYAGARLTGWLESAGRGGGLGQAVADADGQYRFTTPAEARVQVYSVATPPYQPCAVVIRVSGDVMRDVHLVSDLRQLNSGLPPPLLAQSPTVSGIVFETTSEGRRGVSDVLVTWDGSGGGEIPSATTVTDRDGRYVLCGLERNVPGGVLAFKSGYEFAHDDLVVTGDTAIRDIEIRRR